MDGTANEDVLTRSPRYIYSTTLSKEISESVVVFEANLVMIEVLYKSLKAGCE